MVNAQRAAKLSAALARAFGEDFTFTARRVGDDEDVNKPRVADASRSAFTVVGVFAGASKERFPNARGRASDNAQGAVVSGPRVTVEDVALPWLPRDGDTCVRGETGEVYSISRTVPDGFGRTLLYLTARKR